MTRIEFEKIYQDARKMYLISENYLLLNYQLKIKALEARRLSKEIMDLIEQEIGQLE